MRILFSRRSLLIVCICLLALSGLAIYFLAGSLTTEARLNPKGLAYELNLDGDGKLWVSDFNARQVWGVDPISGAYEVYSVSGSPVDARQEAGWLWWADGQSNLIGQVSTNAGTYTEWQIPDVYGFLGTNLDMEGRLYVTDSSNPYLYRLDPNQGELCTYTLPGVGANNYIVRDGEYLWLVDWFDTALVRLMIRDNSLTVWSLPENSSPFGIAADAQGNLWYADQGVKTIVELDPATNQLSSYALPVGNYPQMVAIEAEMVWYTEESLPSIGHLDPLEAVHSDLTITSQDQQLTSSCTSISPSSTGKISITRGKMSLKSMDYTVILNSGGWQIFQMPDRSDPWGIALTDYGYVVDSGRQVLVRFELAQELPTILMKTATPTQLASVVKTQAPAPTAAPTKIPPPEYIISFLPLLLKNSPISTTEMPASNPPISPSANP